MKILQLNTNFRPGGIQRHILELADWLRARGHEVHLGGTSGPWASKDSAPNFCDLPILKVSWEGGNPLNRARALAASMFGLRKYVKRNGIELVHSHESAPALVARFALWGTGVRHVVTYHGSAPDRVGQYARISSSADLVITPSHASAKDLSEVGGVKSDRLKVLGLGLPAPLPAGPQDIQKLRAELIGDGEKLVTIIARLTRQKGIDILIECVARLKETHPEFRFALVGPGPEEETLKKLAQERGVLSHLTFVGSTVRPHDYLRAADLFLLTSRWESLPFTIPEAFQVGCPVVATACSGVVELVDAKVGRTPEIGNLDQICAAIIEILQDDNLRRDMSKNALERSKEKRFDPEWVHQQFEETYLRLIAKAPAKSK